MSQVMLDRVRAPTHRQRGLEVHFQAQLGPDADAGHAVAAQLRVRGSGGSGFRWYTLRTGTFEPCQPSKASLCAQASGHTYTGSPVVLSCIDGAAIGVYTWGSTRTHCCSGVACWKFERDHGASWRFSCRVSLCMSGPGS